MGTKSSLNMSNCLFHRNEAVEGEGGALQAKDGSCLEEASNVMFTGKAGPQDGLQTKLTCPHVMFSLCVCRAEPF